MNVRRSLLTILFALVASLVAAVACGPVNGGSATVHTARTDVAKVLGECKDEIGRFDTEVKDTALVCGVKDASIADQFAENLTAKPAVVVTTAARPAPVDEAASEDLPPATTAGIKSKLPYEPLETPIHYLIKKNKDKQLQISMKIGLRLPKETPEPTRAWALYVVNDCRRLIQASWASSNLDVALQLDEIQSVTNAPEAAAAYDQVLALTGPKDLALNSYPALPMQMWPDRARLLPRGSEDSQAACKGVDRVKKECQLTAVKTANADFCRDFSLMVGSWLGLNRKATQVKEACAKGAVPIGAGDNGTFMKAQALSSDAPSWKRLFTNKDLRRVLAPACKSVRIDPTLSMDPAPAPTATPAPPTAPPTASPTAPPTAPPAPAPVPPAAT